MNKIINITDIPKGGKYEGYLWISDSDKPKVEIRNQQSEGLLTKILSEIIDNSNPFIVEGHLYDEVNKKSYSIRYVDGRHIVVEYNLNNLPSDYERVSFIGNRLDGVSNIKFIRYWKTELDILCECMETFVPAGYVFEGFEYNKNTKEEK